MTTFEEMIEDLEMTVENLLRHGDVGDQDVSGRIPLIFERLTGVQNAIDDWRQGG